GIFEVNVTTSSRGQKTIVATQSHLNKTFINTIHTDGQDRGWKELISLSLDEEVETKNSAESRANETLADANQYTDEQITNQHAVLFEGSANGVGSKVNLLESLYDYNMIVVSGKASGGVFNEVVLPAAIKTNIMIQKVNLSDSDGTFLGIYELKLEVTNGSTLTITSDMSWDNANQSGSGPNRNAFTIQRIEGWK